MDLEEENTFGPGMVMGRGTEPALQLTCFAIRPECLPEIQVSPNAFKADENSTSTLKLQLIPILPVLLKLSVVQSKWQG